MDTKFKRVKTEEDEDDGPAEYPRSEQWRIWKNVLVIGFAFMVHFTAFWGASNLQSSVNADESLGTFTLAAIYGALILSNIFLPAAVIRWLGFKWTMCLSLIVYMPFIASQFYPRFFTMIPAGVAVGIGGGPLWCAKCTYLSVVSEAYSRITGIASDVVVTRFYGVFFMFYQFSQLWGNLISSAVLTVGSAKEGSLENETFTPFNSSDLSFLTPVGSYNANETILEEVEENLCGANFCPRAATTNPNLQAPPESKINLIAGIYLGCMILACLTVAIGVDPLKRYNKGRKSSGSGLSGFRLLAVTLKHLANPYQLLILPITMFIGAEQAFLVADYTAAFVSCGWGISNIGFVLTCFGISNAVAALLTGSIIKITGRNPVIVFALALHVAILVTFLAWNPSSTNKLMYFAMASLWGISDAVWLVQINSYYGILFPGREEAAYSNFRLWESVGSTITYIYNPYLCTDVKLYLLLGLLFIGICGYTTVEYMELRGVKNVEVSRNGNKTFVLVKKNGKSGEVAD